MCDMLFFHLNQGGCLDTEQYIFRHIVFEDIHLCHMECHSSTYFKASIMTF